MNRLESVWNKLANQEFREAQQLLSKIKSPMLAIYSRIVSLEAQYFALEKKAIVNLINIAEAELPIINTRTGFTDFSGSNFLPSNQIKTIGNAHDLS